MLILLRVGNHCCLHRIDGAPVFIFLCMDDLVRLHRMDRATQFILFCVNCLNHLHCDQGAPMFILHGMDCGSTFESIPGELLTIYLGAVLFIRDDPHVPNRIGTLVPWS
jgi:hypothetical protein